MAMKLFVGGIPYDTPESTVRATFAEYGALVDCKLATDRDTGQSKGFAFVEFADDDAAQGAIQALHGSMLEGRRISVEPARPKGDRPARSDRGGYARSGSGGRGRW